MYHESLLDGLHVLLNPFATHPIDPRVFERPDTAVHVVDPRSFEYECRSQDGFLFARMVRSVNITDNPGPIDVGKKGYGAFREFESAPWNEGELIPIQSEILFAVDNHMAHYKGWTIVLYRDAIDNDWGGQAVKALCKELVSFRRHNEDERIESVMQKHFFPTKEEAFEHLKQLVEAAEYPDSPE